MLTWGLFIASLLWALLLCRLIFLFWRPLRWVRLVVFVLVHALGITPLPMVGVAPAVWLWSVFSDLSIASLVLISLGLVRLLFNHRPADHQLMGFTSVVFAFALCYYPVVVAVDLVDLYSWGINSPVLIAIIAVLAFIASFTRFTLIALWGGLTLIAWVVQPGDSVNLFDYLIDPLAFLWCGLILCGRWVRKIRKKRAGLSLAPTKKTLFDRGAL